MSGEEFLVDIQLNVPIYGASFTFYVTDASDGEVRDLFTGAFFSGYGTASKQPYGVYFILAFPEPHGGTLAKLGFSALPGVYVFDFYGMVMTDSLKEVFVSTFFIVHVRASGDADGNGVIDATDALALSSGIVGWGGQPTWSAGEHPESDMDGNGRLTYMDVVHLLRKILGMPSLLEGVAGKIVAAGNTPEVVANARKALADLSDKEGSIVAQLREMILQLVPEVAGGQQLPTAVQITTWGAIKDAYRK